MAERKVSQPETAELLGQQLVEFVDGTEFGTPQFQAVCDYLYLQDLRALREYDIRQLPGDADKTKRESDICIFEAEIALLEHQIEQNKSSLPGYATGYLHMQRAFEDMNSLAKVEAEEKYCDSQDQNRYARGIYEIAFEGAHETVAVKRDAFQSR